MKKVLIILLLIITAALFAQTDYEKWLQKQNEEFTQWKNKQDKDFSSFLEKGWSYYRTEKTAPVDSIPKPQKIPNPVDQNCPDLQTGEIINIEPATVPPHKPAPVEILEQVNKEQLMYAVSKGTETIDVNFWGMVFNLNYNINMKIDPPHSYNEQDIAKFWGSISNTDYEIIHNDLQKIKNKFMFNDWAYCQLVYKAGDEIFADSDMANLFTWFILTKSGYDTKVGYDDEHVYLLLAAQNLIYEKPHLVLNNRDYYAVDLGNKNLYPVNMYTYEGTYPDANDLIDLNISSTPYLNEVIVKRVLNFTYKDSSWQITIRQNKTLIDFLAEYPATELEIYFRSDISDVLKESLVNGLKPVINNKTASEAVNILLHFVQTAFPYQTDDMQFGEENALFPDETIFYEYCDCEDRSFLFSYLVDEFLGLEIIGLDYPGHIATAVNMNYDIEGDKITYNGTDYLICDPTYINADIGVVMPQFANVKPEIIQFR